MKVGRIPGIITLVVAMIGIWVISRHDSGIATISQEVPTRLTPDARVIGTLKTSLTYQFELKSNEFFSLSIEKMGTDIELAVFGPDGKEIRTVECSEDGPVRLSEIASRSGQHSARLKYCDQGGPGRSFELTVSRPRVASDEDRLRVAAERRSAEADMNAAQYQFSSRRAAIEKYEDAIQKWITVGDRVEEIRARTYLARLYSENGNWEKASGASEDALRVARSVQDSASVVSALLAHGAIQLNRGDATEALKTVRGALELSHSLLDRRQEAEANFLLGKIYYSKNLEDAPDTLKEAQRIFRSVENRVGVARTMIYLAAIDSDMNRYDTAIDVAQKALAVFESVGDHQDEGLILIVLGNIQFRMGRPQEALTLYGKAESIVDDSGDLFAEGTLLGGIASAHSDLGQKEAAQVFFARALDKYRELRDRINIAWGLWVLGQCTSELGDTKIALDYLNQAREAFHQIPDKNGEAWVLNEIGLVYEARGESRNAFAYMKQALDLDRSSATPDSRVDAKALSGMGHFYETKGNLNLEKAMENYKEALRLYETAQDRFGSLTTIYRIAHNLHRRGKLNEALKYLEPAVQEIEKVRGSVANSNLRTSYFASARQHYELYIDTLMNVHREIDAFEASEQSRARTLVDMIAETSLALSDGVDPKLIDSKATRIAELDKLSGQLQTLINANDNPKAIEKLNGEITNEKALLDDLDGRIRLQSPKYAAYVQPGTVTLAEVKEQLGDSVMLEYALGEDSSYLFAVTQKEFKSYRLPGKSEIETRVRAFRDLIMTPPSPLGGQKATAAAKAKYEKTANELGALLLGPADGLLGDRRLVIVPDGILQALPFGALAIHQVAGSTFTPLALEHDVVNLASASALVVSRRAAPRRNRTDKTIAVFADAIYQPTDGRFSIRPNVSLLPGSAAAARVAAIPARAVQNSRSAPAAGSDAELPRLRYTQNEANAIFSFVSATDRLDATGWKATKAALQSPDLNRFKYIHIAAHSILNDAYPDLSSLVLSRWDSNGKPIDGSVRLRDVYNLKLSAELVVLSACDTGLGKEVRGEGLMSMVRAFMSIGTPRVLATLWKVDDEQTSAFMTEFYKQLLDKHLSPAEAIRVAQRTLMQKADTQSPYFWAGFQLHGDWR